MKSALSDRLVLASTTLSHREYRLRSAIGNTDYAQSSEMSSTEPLSLVVELCFSRRAGCLAETVNLTAPPGG
ncbi:MAG: hypothetical protein WA783_14665 [Phormidesmis sp.]